MKLDDLISKIVDFMFEGSKVGSMNMVSRVKQRRNSCNLIMNMISRVKQRRIHVT